MKNTLTAGVLLIGNELLSGSIEDRNLAHIAKTLEQRGIRVRETRIVPDIEAEIVTAVNALRQRYDYVFTTGGIGPTHDDITSDSIAAAFGVENVIQQEVYDLIDAYLSGKGVEFTAAAQRMAYAPQGAEMIKTDQSIVPGYRIDNVYVMAGVPRIMRIMLDGIVAHLKTGVAIHNASVHANIGEGEIAAALEAIQNRHPDIDIGSYPQDKDSTISQYRVIFVVKGTDLNEISETCEQIYQACMDLGVEAIIPSG
ncbi:competence/damage-inducible protein A [Arenicella xantha]|uniref:Molybdenum cofactor synthesis domain-containing protein n=1 Tax=Arenicella xantha TaxID=644221 RepID=A0A395JHX2_9GAMM|nr:molybdopterin-binding protein [Arenicella xantha]RBP49615.1 molybdenum cofactor synthesis domain-containing protein [Arenicella xantha]